MPAPVTPLMGWSAADEGIDDDAVAVACAGCGDRIYVDAPSDDAYCAACAMPAAEVAALRMVTPARTDCPLCSLTIYCEDAYNAGTRHAR